MPKPFSPNLVTKFVKCFDTLVEAIIDTGSGLSVISPNLVKILHLTPIPWEGPNILLADRKRVVPDGVVDLRIDVDGNFVATQAAILDLNGYDLLLGNDSLSQLGVIHIQYGKRKRGILFLGGILTSQKT